MASLPVRDRDVVRRTYWDDETAANLAASLGKSKKSVSKALSRVYKRVASRWPRMGISPVLSMEHAKEMFRNLPFFISDTIFSMLIARHAR
jgi:hypothetical protein